MACTNIPSTAEAYSFNVTVVSTAGAGYLVAYPTGASQPFAATLAWSAAGATISNAAIVAAGTGGSVNVYTSIGTELVIDMNGYYTAPSDLSGDTAVGLFSLSSNTGVSNTAVGFATLYSNTTGSANTALGLQALTENTTGANNMASGYQALYFNTTGNDNTATGYQALLSNTTGSSNTAGGAGALQSNTSGNGNAAFGNDALGANTTGINNTATGYHALQDNATGINNAASGFDALYSNTTGSDNTATGSSALYSNTTGGFNTASGFDALQDNTTGGSNTASGFGALQENTTGGYNTAFGSGALYGNTTGSGNTAVGLQALENNTTGGTNIAIGYFAANNVSGGNSNNIHIGNEGAAGDNNVITIGSGQTVTKIAGIYGQSIEPTNLQVCIDTTARLGTGNCSGTPSSRRFKEQIADMGDTSSKLFQLRPVTFLYKPEYDDGSHTLQYGLIAEEVAKLYPEMVEYDKDGQPSSLKYQALTPMLLNEVQKQAEQLRQQTDQNRQQAEQIRSLEDRLAAVEALLNAAPGPAR